MKDLDNVRRPPRSRYLHWLLDGFLLTLGTSLLVCVIGTLLGALVAVGRQLPGRLSWPARAYLSVLRNTPLLVQLFFWYFGVPALLPEDLVFWLNLPHERALGPLVLAWPSFEFLAAALGLSLYTSAFIAEELRAGIASVRPQQAEAGLAQACDPPRCGAASSCRRRCTRPFHRCSGST